MAAAVTKKQNQQYENLKIMFCSGTILDLSL